MSKTEYTSSGVGLGTVIFLIFLIFKLAGVGVIATWSWWWVTLPLWWWIPVLLIILIIASLITVIVNSIK
jgi:hypothetical protein